MMSNESTVSSSSSSSWLSSTFSLGSTKIRSKLPSMDNQNALKNSKIQCGTAWDGFYCWPQSMPGTIMMKSCRDIFDSVGELPKVEIDDQSYNNGILISKFHHYALFDFKGPQSIFAIFI